MRDRLKDGSLSWSKWSRRLPASPGSAIIRTGRVLVTGVPDIHVPLPRAPVILPHDHVLHIHGASPGGNLGASDLIRGVAQHGDGNAVEEQRLYLEIGGSLLPEFLDVG